MDIATLIGIVVGLGAIGGSIFLAAAEAAVALAIVINIYNNLNTINVDEASMMKA